MRRLRYFYPLSYGRRNVDKENVVVHTPRRAVGGRGFAAVGFDLMLVEMGGWESLFLMEVGDG